MKIHLKYIYIGIIAVLALSTGFNVWNGFHKISIEKAAIEKQAKDMESLIQESIDACYKAYDDIKASQEDKNMLKVYEENISKAENNRVKAGIAMSMIDYSIMHITDSTLKTVKGDDEQMFDPAHNLALQNLTEVQKRLLASQSTDVDKSDNDETASDTETTDSVEGYTIINEIKE